MSKKAYNVKATPLANVETGQTASGTEKLKFRASMTVGGRQIERTIVAMGKAADLVRDKIIEGQEVALRVLFERAPANEDGQRGGEFCSVVGIPQPREQQAA